MLLKLLIMCALLPLLGNVANADTEYLHEGSVTSIPIGHYEFCRDLPWHCTKEPGAGFVQWTPDLEQLLEQVHVNVNNSIEVISDMEQYGKDEVWSMGATKGDCEEYVLRKRELLIKAGLSANALRLTIALDENKEGHLFLTVVTDRGDFALDNKLSHIVRLEILMDRYDLIKRTSSWHQKVWVDLIDTRIDLRKAW